LRRVLCRCVWRQIGALVANCVSDSLSPKRSDGTGWPINIRIGRFLISFFVGFVGFYLFLWVSWFSKCFVCFFARLFVFLFFLFSISLLFFKFEHFKS
jgi:hypothetical protein